MLALILAATDEGCRVACIRSGYDNGSVKGRGCACIDIKENYDMFIHNRTEVGSFDNFRHDESAPVKVKRNYFGDDYFER